MSLPIHLGTTRPAEGPGQPFGVDLRRCPHLLISGTTGSGKSVAIHSILAGLLALGPEACSVVLVDPKQVELGDYEGHPSVVGPSGPVVARTVQEATQTLVWVLRQVEERLAVMRLCRAKDISAVPEWIWAEWQRFPGTSPQGRFLVLVVDELADLMMSSQRSPGSRVSGTETVLARILQLGRAAGVHAVLATQRPSADVVTGVVKANVPSRLTFALQSATDSRVAMGRRGAEELEGCGDALYLGAGMREPLRIQGRMIGAEVAGGMLS